MRAAFAALRICTAGNCSRELQRGNMPAVASVGRGVLHAEVWALAVTAVDRVFERRLAGLINSREPELLARARRGLEKESLRTLSDGRIAHSHHPRGLGSALTNPNITTDYSEALLELVTPTFADNAALLDYLGGLHGFVYRQIGAELLWPASMPGELRGDDDVPIADYGRSHEGRFKQIYRRGLLTRYGGMMQAIAGVHFNYSLPERFWPVWAEQLAERNADQAFVSARYFDLLRNFRRHGWLISWLFGASPAMCRSFLQGRSDPELQRWRDDTVYGEYATSLRMSDLGYRNRNQAAVEVSVNSLEEYLRDLMRAAHTPHPPFAALGVKVNGEYRQLNANVLQIENEYYSAIRPKRVPRAGELTGQALARGGVEYVEVRALDLDPFETLSIGHTELCFIEALLVLLLIKDSPPIDRSEQEAVDHNQLLVARRGREPGLRLISDGRPVPLQDWVAGLLDAMQGVCELLDGRDAERPYARALAAQRDKLAQPQLLPSARLLRELLEHEQGFAAHALLAAAAHRAAVLARPVSQAAEEALRAQAEDSLERQVRMDAGVTGDFDDYLRARFVMQLTKA
jgi:glutamate--cysteine ligase